MNDRLSRHSRAFGLVNQNTVRRVGWQVRRAPGRIRSALKDSMVRQILTYSNIALLAERYGECGRGLTASELKVFSQNGEDGVLAEIFRRIGISNRTFVEFGIGEGVEGNAVFLADILGWGGVFFEWDETAFSRLHQKYEANERIRTVHGYLAPDNVGTMFARADVAPEFDLLSIDIDGNDYWVWDALAAPYRPRVVVIEYNGSIHPAARLVQPYDPKASFPLNDYYGASLGAVRSLGERKGYFFVHSELSGNNAFFVRNDFAHHFSEMSPVEDRRANYWLLGQTHHHSTSEAHYLVVGDS